MNYGIEYCYQNPNNNETTLGSSALGNYPTPPTPWTLSSLTAQTANAEAAIDNPIEAYRVVILSGTGSVAARILEGGITESS